MSFMLENAFCRIGELVVYVSYGSSGKFIDGNLYKEGQPMDITLLLEDSSNGIRLQDLVGNGDCTNKYNLGYGSTLVTTTFDYIKRGYVAHNNTDSKLDISSILVSGCLSNNGSVDKQESHSRRAHFWQKMGLTVKDPTSDGSPVFGTLEKMTPPAEPLKWHKTTSKKVEDWIDVFEWNKADDDTLEKLRSFDIDALLAHRLQARKDSKRRINTMQNRILALKSIGAIGGFVLHGWINEFNVFGSIGSLGIGYIAGLIAYCYLPFTSTYESDRPENKRARELLGAELEDLLSNSDKQWQFFHRLSKRCNNELDSFLTDRRLNISASSEIDRLEEFFKKTKLCESAS